MALSRPVENIKRIQIRSNDKLKTLNQYFTEIYPKSKAF